MGYVMKRKFWDDGLCYARYSSLLVFLLLFFIFLAIRAEGAGYQIPNQSMRALGLAGANIAYTPGPDAAHYNPANLVYLKEGWLLEASMTVLGLPEIDYNDRRLSLFNGSSEEELFFLPLIHLAAPETGKFRLGFSLTYPYGLSKEWQQPYPAATAQLFELFVVEARPSVAYAISEKFSLAGGVRFLHGEGEVKNRITSPPFSSLAPLTLLHSDLDVDDMEVGYSLAATYKPVDALTFSATYLSEVTFNLQGNSQLSAFAGTLPVSQYRGGGSIEVPLPAVLNLATAYQWRDITLEFVWSRTFWSAVKTLDFDYDISFLGTLFDGFDRSVRKDWNDSNAFRFGLSYDFSTHFSMTLGFAVDDTPVPEATLGFELPDSDAYMYCLGMQYMLSDVLTLGLSYMYHHTTSRAVTNQSPGGGLPGIDGKFTGGGAHAVNLGFIASF